MAWVLPLPQLLRWDAAYAERWVDSRLARQPMGRERLKVELQAKGISDSVIDEAFRNGGAIQAGAYASGEPQETMRRFFAERAARRAARAKA